MQVPQNRISQHGLSSLSNRIRVIGYTYLVDFGPSTQPRFHTVNKRRSCSCPLKETCPAIEAVAEYLRNGGQRAPDPMPPCPICGADTVRDREWDGKYTKELGWRCTAGGLRHFLEAKAERIKEAIRQQAACQKSGKLTAVTNYARPTPGSGALARPHPTFINHQITSRLWHRGRVTCTEY